MSELSSEDKAWINDVAALSNKICAKLDQLGNSDPDAIGNIGHHLAEVCILSRKLDNEIVPRFLCTPSSDREKLAELSHDLMTELEEIRDSINAMSPDITALMNALNK